MPHKFIQTKQGALLLPESLSDQKVCACVCVCVLEAFRKQSQLLVHHP